MDSHLRPPIRFSSRPPHPPIQPIQNTNPEHHHQDDLNNTLSPYSLVRPPTVKIPPLTFQNSIQPPHPTPPSVPSELNQTQPLVQDASVFITDSNYQTWLPSSSPSLPASSEHPQQPPQLPQQQDFVLFPPQNQPQHSRPFAQTRPNRAIRQNNNQHRTSVFSSLSTQQRQALLSPAFSASGPPSTAALNKRQHPSQRPPVPLFSQEGANNKNMELGNAYRSVFFHETSRLHQYRSDIDLEPFVAFEGGATASDFSSPPQQVLNFDMSSSHSSSHFGTVSPHDLYMANDILSNPGSAALTALTTPSGYDGSPAFDDCWDHSPLFPANEIPENWTSLFPDAKVDAPSAAPAAVDQSPSTASDDLESTRRPSEHRKSSATSSPSGRHSSVAGVNARRRGKPLPPITVDDPSDVVSMKRAKNTLAARKSRQRKAERMDELEQKINALQAEKEKLQTENEKLQAQCDHWRTLATQ